MCYNKAVSKKRETAEARQKHTQTRMIKMIDQLDQELRVCLFQEEWEMNALIGNMKTMGRF